MYAVPELVRDRDFLASLGASLAGDAPPPALRCIKIKLTSRCNLRCTMCKYWKTTREDTLGSERWREVFAELPALGCRKIHFSGGEVFLRRDFLDLVEAATRHDLKVNFTTNGTLVTKDAAKRIASLGVNAVSISLDGADAATHEAIRGRRGAFRRSLAAVRWIKRYGSGVKVRINFVIMASNFRELPEAVRLAGELGATDLVPMPIDEKGERRGRLTRSQIRAYNREIAPRVLELRRRYGFPTDPARVYPFGVTEEEIGLSSKGLYARGFFDRRACLAPWLHAFFAWNGDTFLCCMTNGRMESLGNLGTDSVREIFEGPRFAAVRREFLAGRALSACRRCDLFLPENALLHASLDERGQSADAGIRRGHEAAALTVGGPSVAGGEQARDGAL